VEAGVADLSAPSAPDRQSVSVLKGRPESLHASQERIVHDEDQRAPMTKRITRFGPLPNGVCDGGTMGMVGTIPQAMVAREGIWRDDIETD
jgi:hypothetical protein